MNTSTNHISSSCICGAKQLHSLWHFYLLGTKLSKECCKYGAENINDNVLAKAVAVYGDAHKHIEKEQEDYVKIGVMLKIGKKPT